MRKTQPLARRVYFVTCLPVALEELPGLKHAVPTSRETRPGCAHSRRNGDKYAQRVPGADLSGVGEARQEEPCIDGAEHVAVVYDSYGNLEN